MVIKEKTQVGISEELLREYKEEAAERRKWEEEQKQKTPEAPDESEEIGKYDENASKWFGGHFIYKTDSGKYFTLTGEGYEFVNPLHLESYLMSLRKKVDQQKKTD